MFGVHRCESDYTWTVDSNDLYPLVVEGVTLLYHIYISCYNGFAWLFTHVFSLFENIIITKALHNLGKSINYLLHFFCRWCNAIILIQLEWWQYCWCCLTKCCFINLLEVLSEAATIFVVKWTFIHIRCFDFRMIQNWYK